MGVDIPQPFKSTVSGPGGSAIPVNATANVTGIPDRFHIDVESLPKIQLGIDPVTINPVDVSIAISRLPDIRTHLPADFSVGLSIFGLELMCVRLCGEAQMITEPYEPNPCERCGTPRHAVNELPRRVASADTPAEPG